MPVALAHTHVRERSRTKQVACLAGWIEFWLGFALGPPTDAHWAPLVRTWGALTLYAGVALVVGGLALRVCAMWTAGRNFSHMIVARRATARRPN